MNRKRTHARLTKVGDDTAVQQLLPLTTAQQKLVKAASDIALHSATADDACYLHTVLCQVGMPRKRTDSLSFERTNGAASLLLSAGKLWNGRHWVQQLLPYGPKPRLILINLTTAAVLTGSRMIDVGRSTREFMERVGLDNQGSEYRSLRRQIAALAACRMQLGVAVGGSVINLDTQPIHRFDVWIVPNQDQQTLWPGVVELSQEYFDGIREHAVPLDERAVAALRGSALALDIYTWLAHRLHRVREANGARVRWQALASQFGQEYKQAFHFRAEFRETMAQVLAVYPGARVEETSDGLLLRLSPPPIPKTRLQIR